MNAYQIRLIKCAMENIEKIQKSNPNLVDVCLETITVLHGVLEDERSNENKKDISCSKRD